MTVDLSKLSAEETISVALEALGNLTIDERIEIVKQLFRDSDDKAELIAELED